MKNISLGDTKVGDRVKLNLYGVDVTGTILNQNSSYGNMTLIGWTAENKKKYASAWLLADRRNEECHKDIPQKYTHAYYVPRVTVCRIVSKHKDKNLGFLVTCILAGAGLAKHTKHHRAYKLTKLPKSVIKKSLS